MKKLVILPVKKTRYSKIIHRIKKLKLKDIEFCFEENLNFKLIKRFDVVVFESIKINFLKKIHEERIILININKYSHYNK